MTVAAADRQGPQRSPEVELPPPRRAGIASRIKLPGTKVAFLAPAIGTFLLLCFRNRYVFSLAIREDGDFAANAILIQRAAHFHQLVGEYSRVGFNHPGPAFLYVEAAGQTLFYSLLHLVPSAYDGQLMATFVLNAVVVGLVVWIVYRQGGSGLAAGMAYAVIIAYSGYHLTFASPWFPHLFFACFLLLMVAGASIASNDLRDLPAYVFAGAMLAHGHTAFLEFVGVWTAVVAVAWFRRHRRRLRSEVADQRRPVTIAAVLLGVFLLPMVLNVVLHFPGEWRKYASYLKHNGANTHPVRAAFDYLLSFWAHRPLSGALMVAAVLLAVVLTATEPDGDRRRFFGWMLGAALAMSVLFLAYAVRGVDDLSQGYIGIFYMTVPLVVLMVAAAAVTTAVGRRADKVPAAVGLPLATAPAANGGPRTPAASAGRRSLRDHVGLVIPAALTVGLLVAGATGPMVSNPYRGRSDLAAAVATVKAAPGRDGRTVAIQFPHDSWPVVVGFLVNARRAGVVSCLDDPFWTFMVTTDYICRPGAAASSWQVRFDPVTAPGAPGAQAIWSDTEIAITAAR
jgi:hypothetical protein